MNAIDAPFSTIALTNMHKISLPPGIESHIGRSYPPAYLGETPPIHRLLLDSQTACTVLYSSPRARGSEEASTPQRAFAACRSSQCPQSTLSRLMAVVPYSSKSSLAFPKPTAGLKETSTNVQCRGKHGR